MAPKNEKPGLRSAAQPVILKGNKDYLAFSRRALGRVALCALLCTSGVFLMLPFTQMIAGFGKQRPNIVSVDVALQPPPPPPPDMTPPEPPEQEPPPPEMQEQVQPLSLSQMDVALNLGTGGATAGGFAFEGFALDSSDTVGDLQIFDVKDLDQTPRMLQQGQFVYPPELRRARVSGSVSLIVIINESGGVKVESVAEGRVKEFVESAIRFAESSRFETPKKGGKAVRARYTFPVRFAL